MSETTGEKLRGEYGTGSRATSILLELVANACQQHGNQGQRKWGRGAMRGLVALLRWEQGGRRRAPATGRCSRCVGLSPEVPSAVVHDSRESPGSRRPCSRQARRFIVSHDPSATFATPAHLPRAKAPRPA